MKGRPDVAGKVFGALGRHNINISAIAQGASERNISCVVDASQQSRALNVIHQRVLRDAQVAGARGGRRRQHRRRAAAAAVRAAAVPARAGLRRQGDRRRQQQTVRRQRATASTSAAGARSSTRPTRRMDPRALAQEIAELALANAALIDCTADAVDRRRLSGVHQGEPAHRHAEQARECAAVAALRRPAGAAGRSPEAVSVRNQRRRRTAHHLDAARSDRRAAT